MTTHVPPLNPGDPAVQRLFFTEPPLQPAFMPQPTTQDAHTTGQNHDRSFDGLPPPPPQPPAPLPLTALLNDTTFTPPPIPPDPPAASTDPHPASDNDRASDASDGTSTGSAESEEDDEQPSQQDQWRPIDEDKSVPCADELVYITQRGEHSALDHSYWEKKIYFDFEDPEIYPVGSGRIDWLVEHFNGTKEKPNRDNIMRSQIVTIGGYEWRIKLFPKGNNSEYLSVYIENVSMQDESFKEFADFAGPPLPFLDDREKLRQSTSIAVQLGVVMYNPNEPRVYEYQTDAHQFTKALADYGWTRFTRHSRREFAYRMHGQRQAILRDDKLAFSAYIRLIHDPTHCMWSHSSDSYDNSLKQTGLRPFSTLNPMFGAKLPLLHFAPFRDLIRDMQGERVSHWLQCLLWKMLSRTRSSNYGNPLRSYQCDPIAWLQWVARGLQKEVAPSAVDELIGTFDPELGTAVGANKLKTRTNASVQAAIDVHPSPIATPALLTLELERGFFDRKQRKWLKITNKVDMQNRISVAGKTYLLYAFATHCGELESNRFNLYIRPRGPETLWYAYTDGSVTAMTQKQAIDAHCGFDAPASPVRDAKHRSSKHRRYFRFDDINEVAHVVYYVRDDYRSALTQPRVAEAWKPREAVKTSNSAHITSEPTENASQLVAGFGESKTGLDRELYAELEPTFKRNPAQPSGAATPSWIADGEDIVMSDALPEQQGTLTSDPAGSNCTIEHLGREYYKGSLLDGRYHGQGHLISMNGDEYIGSFIAGEKSGQGKMIYSRTGNMYEGSWSQDQHHGQGTLTEAKTGNVFEGGWKHGKKSGSFVLKGTVTDEDKGCCSICYEKEINTAFYDCGHVLACRECAFKVDTCPVCRRRVVGRLELFGVKLCFE